MAEKNYSGDFIQLIRKSIAEPEPKVLCKETQENASTCLSNFKNKLAAYDLHNSLSLFSVLSISDDNFKGEEADIEFLFTLLSNTGFLFDEARTPLRGSLAPEEEWTQKVSMEWRDHSGYHSNGGRSSALTLIEQGAEGQISEAEKRLFNALRSKFEEKNDEQPPKILVDLTNVAAEGNHDWLRSFLLSRFSILKDNQYTYEQQLSKMDLDLAMFRGFDAHGIMQDHSAGCDLERDGYGEPRVFTLRKVLSLLKRICDEVESDYEDAKVATAQIVSMETNDRYKRFCKIYNRLEEEKELINDVGLNPYSHAKKWILDANGVTDYVTSVAQDMRKAAKKHGTESAIFRNVGLKHLPELPSFDKEFYAKDAEFRNLVKELKEAFLTYRGNAVESSIILDDNIWEIARLSLHDAFTFFVDECDIDLTYAPVVCYLVIRKYGTAISKKRIKSTQISLFAIFDRYHMARSNKKVARQDFRLYANLRAAFSHFYGAALPGAVKMLWDDAFLSCSTYLDQQYDFLKSVINEEFGADSELFASIRQIHACVVNVNEFLSHTPANF